MQYDVHDLIFIRRSSFNPIPRYLIEQLNENWDIDKLYSHGHLLIHPPEAESPTACLFTIHHKTATSPVIGFLWLTIDIIDNHLEVIALSIDRQYQNMKIIPYIMRYLRRIQHEFRLHSIRIITKRPKAFERYGFRRSKHILMEA